MSRTPHLTDAAGDGRFYTTDTDESDGEQAFGPDTVGIVDEARGGVIAYVHRDNAGRVILGLQLAEVAEAWQA